MTGTCYSESKRVKDEELLRQIKWRNLEITTHSRRQRSLDAVRSSIARKLGLDIGALAPSDRHVDGVVEVVLDATHWLSWFLGCLLRAVQGAVRGKS
jgi:hypothetical protein